MSDSNELVVIQKQDLMTVFTVTEQLDPILEKIAKEARSVVPDVSTAKGRDAIKSMAYKVAKSRTYLDGLGKDLVTEMKELPKRVDEHRRKAREFLEALQEEVRKPLTEWEAEQARIEAEKKAASEAKALAEKEAAEAAAMAQRVENDHELGLLLNAEFDRQAQAKKEAEIQAAKERDERIAREAAEAAKREAEAKAAKEKADAEAREIALRVQAARAEQDRLDAIAKAEAAAAKAEKDAKEAAEKAERDALEAVESERRRVAAQKAQEEKERAEREADKAHRGSINSAAAAAIVAQAGVTEDQARNIVIAIAKGLIPSVKVSY